tara:strand:+ start:417 stop:638 length:222 start_codon:yes stop_codon:yes gene_type:complete
MTSKLLDSYTVIADTESNKDILNSLKISFKEDYQKRTGQSYLRLFFNSSQDHNQVIETLNTYNIMSYNDQVLD